MSLCFTFRLALSRSSLDPEFLRFGTYSHAMAAESAARRVIVFIDHQNVTMDARRAFFASPYGAADGQIDPILYSQHLVAQQPLGASGRRTLEQVRIYRGRPHSEKEPRTNAAHMRQVEAWKRDGEAWKPGGVEVITRDLRYPGDWPKSKAEEKGIDVALAIDAIRLAILGQLDVAILATTDTDQRPVLEAFHQLPMDEPPVVEVATWRSPAFSKRLQVRDLHVWSHYLDGTAYRKVRDSRDYNVPSK